MRSRFALAARRQPEAAGWYTPADLLGADLVIGLLALIGGSAIFLRPMWSLGDGTPTIEASWAVLGVVAAGLLWQRFRADWVIYLGRRMPDLVFVHFMAVASVIWSLEPAHSAERALWLLSTTMVGICIGYSRDPKQVMAIVMWLFTFFVAASVIAVFLFPDFGQHPRSEQGGVLIDPSLTGRWRGILLNKNEFGSIASGAAVFFAIASLHGRISPVVGLPLFVLAVLMVLMSASATAHVLLILSSVTILLFYVSKKFKVTNIVFALSLILALPATLLALENFDLLTRSLQRDTTLTSRVDIWQDALQVVQQAPLLGFGYGAIWLADERTWFPHLSSTTSVFHAHNGYLQIAADLGLPAALAAIALLVRTALLAFRTYVGTGSAFAFFCFIYTLWFMIFNLTETRLFQLRRIDWILFVVVAVCLMRSVTPESRPLKRPRG
jgi:exopolysaccharide production protein ExoQ